MYYADILIDEPSRALKRTFTYLLPEHLLEQAAAGKRVLIQLGNSWREGYILKIHTHTHLNDLKPIHKVLDQDTVIDNNLFELAIWMSEQYICSLSQALESMLPSMLNKPREPFIIPIVNREMLINYNNGTDKSLAVLLEHLANGKELSLKEALNLVDRAELDAMQSSGMIYIGKEYKGYRDSKVGYAYKLNSSSGLVYPEELEKKAPRQAEILNLLKNMDWISREELEKNYPRSSIAALLKKGYIEIFRPPAQITAAKYELNDEQRQVINTINKSVNDNQRVEYLLYGVTGSGKTEVYISAAEHTIKNNKQVIVLVPEIALTRHLINVFAGRIPRIQVIHSDMPALERYDAWQRIRSGEVDLVLGTRSAIFAPLSRVALIIIDEEQEHTYKQSETPRYDAREVARKRSLIHSAVLVTGSATPSIETYWRAMSGKAALLELNRRVEGIPLPKIVIEDRKRAEYLRKGIFTPQLLQRIKYTVDNGEQCILFLNRRGYLPMTICRQCGKIATCPDCSVSLNYHKDLNNYVCHYCNYRIAELKPCSCGSSYLDSIGYGTQRIETEMKELFPQARIKRLDWDSSRKRGSQKKILDQMKSGEIDILIGTQMVAKGFDFPGVSLVGIVDADAMLSLPDFRAGERAYQLMVQAAGRAGRGLIPGEVIIQTYQPDNAIIKLASSQDYRSFYAYEIKWRRELAYPPFTTLLRIVVSHQEERLASTGAEAIREHVEETLDYYEGELQLLGPALCPIYKIGSRFRYQLLLKSDNELLLRSVGAYIADRSRPDNVRIEIDINPVSMM
ncbi:MAG: replication restart helicase PriA [Syntrophomonadaceae bacterium]|jgi:primosomal protein N' (replication factor Y)